MNQGSNSNDSEVNNSPNSNTIHEDNEIITGNELVLSVPKTNGSLMVNIRYLSHGTHKGYYIHHIDKRSNVYKYNILQYDDEILLVDNVSVQDKSMNEVIDMIRNNTKDNVLLHIRREITPVNDKVSLFQKLYNKAIGSFIPQVY
jgi:hypothetical protein